MGKNEKKGQKDARFSPMSELTGRATHVPPVRLPRKSPRSWSLRIELSGETSHRYTSPPLRAGKVRNLTFQRNPPSLGFEPYSTTAGALGNQAFRLPSTTREAVQFELFIVITCAADEIKR